MSIHKPDFIDECYSGKNLKLLQKLTLVIPTHNRNYYLSRCLWYHAHFPFGKLIVADSSSDNKKNINKETVNKIKKEFGTDILYLEYTSPKDNDKYGKEFYKKWADGVQHVSTEYSQICTDKEFSIPDATVTCIQYLDENPEIMLSEGVDNYIEMPKPGKFLIRNMYPSKCSLMEEEAISRLKKATSGTNISSNLLGIRRTAFHKELFNYLYKCNVEEIRSVEFTIEFLTIARSKTNFINTPFCYRDISNYVIKKSFQKSESSSLQLPFLSDYNEPGALEDIMNKYINCLAPEIVKNSNIDIASAKDFISTELDKTVKKRGFYGNTKMTQNPLWYLWRHSPYWLKLIGGKITPKKILDISKVRTPNEVAITKLIADTTYEHDNDLPVPYLSKHIQ